MNKVRQITDSLGNNIQVLNIKDLIIAKNVVTIVERLELIDSDYEFENEIDKDKIRKSIDRLRETNEIIKEDNIHYRFGGVYVIDRSLELVPAKWDPKFIAKWKISMETVAIPPTILDGIDELMVKRAYDHIKFNDMTDPRREIGSGLIEFASIRYGAVNNKLTKKFTIAFSFTEGINTAVTGVGPINYKDLGL